MLTEKSPELRVLIVDDEPLIRWSMAETLSDAGHAVAEASDAKETLRQLSSGPAPDVILLDYRLPDSNDLRLLANIRQTVPTSSVIMMTAYGTPEVVNGAVELGAYRVLSKPVEMRDLVPLVHQAHCSRPH
jgi:two-component system, NtrC family, response regulator AtoC